MRLLRRNLVLVYGSYAAAAVTGLVVTPIAVRALGLEAYGAWAFIGSLVAYFGLLDLGVGPSIVRRAAEARGRRAPEEISTVASVGLTFYGLIGGLAALLGALLAWSVPLLLDLPHDLVWPARVATLIVVGGEAVRLPLALFSNLLAAQQRYDVLGAASILGFAAYGALVAALLTRTGGIVLLSVLALSGALIRLIFPLAWIRRELPSLRLRRTLVTRERARELLRTSLDNLLIHVAARVVFTADVVIVGIVLGAKAAALYAIPAKLFSLAYGVGTVGTNLLFPAYAELEGTGDALRQRLLLRAGLRAGMAAILFFALPLMLLPEQLMEAWIGRELDQSVAVLVLLGAALVIHQPTHLVTQYLIARGRQRPAARILVVVMIANVGLSIALALTVGIWGVALSTLVAEAAAVVLIPRLGARAAGLPLVALARAALRPVAPALALAVPLLLVAARLYDSDDLLSLLPLGVVWTLAFPPVIWWIGLSPEERSALARRLRPQPALAGSEAAY